MSKPLYLASQSPRRLELLRQIGLLPTVLRLRGNHPRADVDETPQPGEAPDDYVRRLAVAKAEVGLLAIRERDLPVLPVVAADTTVVIDGEILGKPADAAEAAAMLRRYSGREHQVLTGVAVAMNGQMEVAGSDSRVRFKTLDEADIAAYVASQEWADKAGGYGIQGKAAVFVEHLSGSYTGVVGLPLFETAALLRRVGFGVL